MNLEQTASALIEQFPAGKTEDLDRTERRLERFGQIAFGGFGIVLALAILGIIYTIVTKFIVAGTQPLVGVLLVLFMVFAALTLAYVVFKEDLKEKRKAGQKPKPSIPQIDTAEANRLTEGSQLPVPSVIENTTDLLPVKNNTRKL